MSSESASKLVIDALQTILTVPCKVLTQNELEFVKRLQTRLESGRLNVPLATTKKLVQKKTLSLLNIAKDFNNNNYHGNLKLEYNLNNHQQKTGI